MRKAGSRRKPEPPLSVLATVSAMRIVLAESAVAEITGAVGAVVSADDCVVAETTVAGTDSLPALSTAVAV